MNRARRLLINDTHDAQGVRVLSFSGPLTIENASQVSVRLANVQNIELQEIFIDLQDVNKIDTTGAWLLYRTMRDWHARGVRVSLHNASAAQRALIDRLKHFDAPCPIHAPYENPYLRPIIELGKATYQITLEFGSFLAFLGQVSVRFFSLFLQPWRIRGTALTHQIEEIGFYALPIIGLMSFLIGVVLVQQGAFQLRQFGAEVYVVNLVAISVLRELGILLTAIMVAGRSGSAFTAQIGSMVLQEEVDAMRTIGLDPIERLVIPRVLALVLVMPILAFYANIMALVGAALFSWLQLGITVPIFLERMQESATINDFLVGMFKAPVFGAIIAVTGCFQGMCVRGGAQSVGVRTTMSVVQSIFLVIVLDAFFAIFFTIIGL
jgi:phospholipid/cholesterol/gamma-HCH transport system permease protein